MDERSIDQCFSIDQLKETMINTKPTHIKTVVEAVRSGNLEMVKWLVKNGAKITRLSLDLAAHHGHQEVLMWMMPRFQRLSYADLQ